jgi:membrane-anchored protein YejM (alkaline phosphatase superfamily)
MITCVIGFIINFNKSEVYGVVSSIAGNDNEAKKIYIKNYILQFKKTGNLIPMSSGQITNENIIVLQLESLNSDLLNQETTPNLINIINDGVYMPKMQSASINSIRTLEGVLCGLIPSLSSDVSKIGVNLYGLNCLPKILSGNGYKTFYFQSADILNDTKPFVTKLGFDETHFEDIMEPNDKILNWGYRDDIFIQRVFEYLERYKGEKFFAFIDLSSNHFPFWDLSKEEFPEFNSKVPYPNPKVFKQELQNTTFIQDVFVGEFYKKYQNDYANNTALIMFGDHSWPYGVHDNNIFNENYMWQENLITPFIYVPAKTKASQYAVGGKINKIYSQYDVPSTILDMLEIADNFHKQSFFSELTKPSESNENNACIISTQPFAGGYISLLKYPKKYILNLKKQVVDIYDLNEDPNEFSPKENSITQDYLSILEGCIKENIQTN